MTVTRLQAPQRGDVAPSPVRRRRSSRLVLLAVVLTVLGALSGAYAFSAATGRIGVVSVARPLPVGATLELGDVREVQLPEDTGLATVDWNDLDQVVGKTVVSDLHTGQIVTPDAVTDAQVPAAGEAVVGVSVAPGRAPATTLADGDQVLIVTGAGRAAVRGSVVAAGEPDVSGRRGIDVLVRQADAEELALASVDDHVAIVLVGRG